MTDTDSADQATKPKPRTRKKPSARTKTDEKIYHGEIIAMKPDGAARRIFRGVKLPEAPSFTLESASDPNDTAEFTGIASLPGISALELVVDGITGESLPVFFSQILGEDEYERFKEFAHDPEHGITLSVLVDLAKYLMEEYTGRPT